MEAAVTAPPPRGRSGASLLLTLVVTAGVVILFVILARVVMSERRVSRGYSDILRAGIAAEAAAEDAKNLLLDLFATHPDSATYWEPEIGPGTPGTVFVYRDRTPGRDSIAYDSSGYATDMKILARPLVSGAETKELYPADTFDESLPPLDAENSIDINAPERFDSADPNGWVGVPPDEDGAPARAPEPVRVPWVEMLEKPGEPRDLAIDPSTGRPHNAPLARYAFWIEDESFKLNVNAAKAKPRGAPADELEGEGDDAKPDPRPSLQGVFDGPVADGVEAARESVSASGGRLLSPRQIGHSETPPAGMDGGEFARAYKFLLTTESSGLNLSRAGAKRLNVNDVVDACYEELLRNGMVGYQADGYSGADGIIGPNLSSPQAAEKIGDAVKRIVRAIDEQSPDFGQRFYRKVARLTPETPAASRNQRDTQLASQHADIYLHKIAANIHDYISPLRNPTVLNRNSNLDVFLGGVPNAGVDEIFPSSGTGAQNSIAAVGKKAVPGFQAYLLHAKLLDMTPKKKSEGQAAKYDLEIDHCFGFWNMTGSDIIPARGDLGPEPFLALQNQPRAAAGGRPGLEGGPKRDFEIRLGDKFKNLQGGVVDLVFRAGSFTVITTDPDFAENGKHLGIPEEAVYIATALYRKRDSSNTAWVRFDQGVSDADSRNYTNVRRYTGTTTETSDGYFRLQVEARDSTTNSRGDNLTQVLLGNRYGLLDGFPSVRIQRTSGSWPISLNLDDEDPEKGNKTLNFFRSSQIYAGRPSESTLSPFESTPADPRANMEALKYELRFTSMTDGTTMEIGIGDNAKTSTQVAGLSNLGEWAKNQDPANRWWPSDRTDTLTGPAYAPAVIAYGPMRSIGELGHIYDPIRFGTGAERFETRRGGGRTLTVGQPDVLWDGTRPAGDAEPALKFQLSRSREWAAWRLCDIFTVRDDDDLRGDEENGVPPVEVEGLYNPNGILRDNGRVLRALLAGLRFSEDEASHPKVGGRAFDTDGMDERILEKLSASDPVSADPGGQALAACLARRLSRKLPSKFSPIWEPGELSQIEIFDPQYPADQIVDGVQTAKLNDRAREELFRRLAELVTPKGNTFTIYVVGQALAADHAAPSGVRPTATKAQRWTVRLRPVFDGPLDDEFDPLNDAEVTQRFRPPARYRIEVLGVEDA